MSAGLTSGVTLTAEHGTADFWMKRYVIVLAAIVADNIKTLMGIVA